jgi:hypothetical protein
MHEEFQEVRRVDAPIVRASLMVMGPVPINTLPRGSPHSTSTFQRGSTTPLCGSTRHLRQRLRQHSIPAAQHNQAVFAFRLAREMTGRLITDYSATGARVGRGHSARGHLALAPHAALCSNRAHDELESEAGHFMYMSPQHHPSPS